MFLNKHHINLVLVLQYLHETPIFSNFILKCKSNFKLEFSPNVVPPLKWMSEGQKIKFHALN